MSWLVTDLERIDSYGGITMLATRPLFDALDTSTLKVYSEMRERQIGATRAVRRPEVTLIIAQPGAGKSTFLLQNAGLHSNRVTIDSDSFRRELPEYKRPGEG